MEELEAIKAADAARAVLEDHGWDVQEVVLHAATRSPADDKFDYTVVSYTSPEKIEPSVRGRLFNSLVSTAEKFGFTGNGSRLD